MLLDATEAICQKAFPCWPAAPTSLHVNIALRMYNDVQKLVVILSCISSSTVTHRCLRTGGGKTASSE